MTLRLVCVVRIFVFITAETAKGGCTAGRVVGEHIMHVPGMSVAGLCASLRGVLLDLPLHVCMAYISSTHRETKKTKHN